MIAIVVAFLVGGHPVFALQSVERFDSMEACEAALPMQRDQFEAAAHRISVRVGLPVNYEAGCINMVEGTPA